MSDDIIDRLMTNGMGDRAVRIVLISADGRDLGGWGESSLRRILTEAQRERDTLRGLLVEVEWVPLHVSMVNPDSEQCPVCRYRRKVGRHAHDCRLDAALKEGQ